jgi:hypothetical protein
MFIANAIQKFGVKTMQSRFAQDVVDFVGTPMWRAGLWIVGSQWIQNAMNNSRYGWTSWGCNTVRLGIVRYPTEGSPYARTLILGWIG